MEYIKVKADEAKKQEIQDFYHAPTINDPKRVYDLFQVMTNDSVYIKGYRSKKLYTIVFMGEKNKIIKEASLFFKNPSLIESKKPYNTKGWKDIGKQIGSDEVGVGDFFLGFYVCAAYLDSDDISFIDSLHVLDSKKMTDSKMEEIGPLLIKKIKHIVIIVSTNRLAQLTDKKWSTHMILAKAHNLAHAELIKKFEIANNVPIYVDQFEIEKIYRHYVGSDIVTSPIVFHTKGESFYPSVATASVIARYSFLKDWEKMEADFGTKIPKGAGSNVDLTYIQLLKKYGHNKVDSYVKQFFRNYKDQEGKY